MTNGALRAAEKAQPRRRRWRHWGARFVHNPIVWLLLWLVGAAVAIALVGLVMLRP